MIQKLCTVALLASVVSGVPVNTTATYEKDCTLPRVRGDFCDAQGQVQMFYYTSQGSVCQPFMYNGCNGNGNRFSTLAECQDFCITKGGALKLQDATTSDSELMKAACSADYDTDHLTPTRCNNARQCGTGNMCTNGFCCPTPAYICSLNYDTGKFSVGGVKSDKYFWNNEFNVCMRFSFYGTLGNANNFPNYNSCMKVCSQFGASNQ